MPFQAVEERLRALGLHDVAPGFWVAVRGNVATLAEAADWYRICREAIARIPEAPGYLAEAAALLPAEPWDETSLSRWTPPLQAATGMRGGSVLRPLGLALHGR